MGAMLAGGAEQGQLRLCESVHGVQMLSAAASSWSTAITSQDSRTSSVCGAGAGDTGRDVCLIADGQNHAIRVLDLLTRRVTTLAGGAGVDGAADGAGSEARFAYPVALAARSLSSLEVYIADMYNSRVRRMVLTVSSGADGAAVRGVRNSLVARFLPSRPQGDPAGRRAIMISSRRYDPTS